MVGNLSATLNVIRLLFDPSLCLPHATISTFAHLRIPLCDNFVNHKPDIRAVILDKDNCFAIPGDLNVHKPYSDTFEALRKAYPGNRLLIVSNSSGTSNDQDFIEADLLSKATSVPVFHHSTKKPGCHAEIMAHLRSCPDVQLESASQVAIVGDRLFTDVMMANMMGAWAVYVKDGVDLKYSTVVSCATESLSSDACVSSQERLYAPDTKIDIRQEEIVLVLDKRVLKRQKSNFD